MKNSISHAVEIYLVSSVAFSSRRKRSFFQMLQHRKSEHVAIVFVSNALDNRCVSAATLNGASRSHRRNCPREFLRLDLVLPSRVVPGARCNGGRSHTLSTAVGKTQVIYLPEATSPSPPGVRFSLLALSAGSPAGFPSR